MIGKDYVRKRKVQEKRNKRKKCGRESEGGSSNRPPLKVSHAASQ